MESNDIPNTLEESESKAEVKNKDISKEIIEDNNKILLKEFKMIKSLKVLKKANLMKKIHSSLKFQEFPETQNKRKEIIYLIKNVWIYLICSLKI